MNSLQQQQVRWDHEGQTIEAGRRAWFDNNRHRADGFEWTLRFIMVACAVGGIGFSVLGAA